MAKVNYAVGPCFKGIMDKWRFPPPNPNDPDRINFYAFASQAGDAVFMQITVMLLYVDPQTPYVPRPEIAAIAQEIISHGLKLHLAFDILDPGRTRFLYEENIPPWIQYGDRYRHPDFRAAVTREMTELLALIRDTIGGPTFASAVDMVHLAMEVNGVKNMGELEYRFCKDYYNELAQTVKNDFGLAGKVGIYLGGKADRATGKIDAEVVTDLRNWFDAAPNLDAFGCSWYPQDPSHNGGYNPENLDRNALTEVAQVVHGAGKRLVFPEIGYPSDEATYHSSEQKQERFAQITQQEVLPNATLGPGDRAIWFVLVDENFRPIYNEQTTFESMGLWRNYNSDPVNAKPAWATWLAGVNR